MNVELSLESKIKRLYHRIQKISQTQCKCVSVFGRSIIRFLAIPVAFSSVDWEQCVRNPILVFCDHFYIYFVLGYYPDNYNSCRLWEIDRSEWSQYLGSGYDPRAIYRREKHILKGEHSILFEDKEVCYQMCRSFGLPLPKQYGVIGPDDEFAKKINTYYKEFGAKKIILKDVHGCGGSGIHMIEKFEGKLIVRDASSPDKIIAIDQHSVTARVVAQEFVTQHPRLDSISDKALNTVRIVTLYTPENEVKVVGAYLRIGISDSFIDNGCQGNAGVNIDLATGKPTGKILTTQHKEFDLKHKENGNPITEVALPDWIELVELAETVQKSFAPYNRFIGMDLAFSENGPVVIELNDIFDGAYFEKYCGPMLADPTVYNACVAYELLPRNLLSSEPVF